MIPKTIHFCWYGKGEYNETIKKCIASWEEKLPDYTIKKWDETNTPFDKLPFLKLLYKQKKWSFITDYVRLYALYKEGGVYMDTDIEILKRFDNLHNEESFTGFQTNMEDSPFPIAAGMIGAKKGNIFILDCIKETERKQRLKFNGMGGPPILTKVLLSYGLKEYKTQTIKKVLVLDKKYFYPFYINEKFTEECIKPETICIHWWEDSWGNKQKGFSYILDSLNRKSQKLPLIFLNKIRYAFFEKSFYIIDRL
ncbi:glycosyltransferase [Tenacibaculum finnmarkense genomovar ulcerans]|uniref:glycosyltransferase family 32 protein n=1 Tax=Tenacibaculum finnmarkense TaxID=2781243 RepID=UPI00187B16F0|nr:glycosyltransferase [Tenacibaculum finnmarkense]MBE7634022.1 glycosyltransferase [Tenacibaculum finnmarkense genomovar ulcerans]